MGTEVQKREPSLKQPLRRLEILDRSSVESGLRQLCGATEGKSGCVTKYMCMFVLNMNTKHYVVGLLYSIDRLVPIRILGKLRAF